MTTLRSSHTVHGLPVDLKIEASRRRTCHRAEATVLGQVEHVGPEASDEQMSLADLASRVDRAVARVLQLRPPPAALTLSFGPVARHVGTGSAVVAVASVPGSAVPVHRVRLTGESLATWEADRDTATSAPQTGARSLTVIADSAVAAAAVATEATAAASVGTVPLDEPVPELSAGRGPLNGHDWLCVRTDGTTLASVGWQHRSPT